MSKFVTLHGFGGGSSGTELNFEIVGGTTEPTNPTENMIWVNTNVEITDYIFSVTQPDAVDGRIWIYTGTLSIVEFNALKDSGIQVYPISAKQYVSGAWVDITAKSYQNDEWVDWWDGTLLDGANTYDSFTGGWFRDTGMRYTNQPNTGTVVFDSNGVKLGTVAMQSAVVRTKKPIDISLYKKLSVTVSSLTVASNISVRVYVTQSASGDPDGFTGAKIENITSAGDYELYLTGLTSGEYYIVLATANTRGGTVNKVKLQ